MTQDNIPKIPEIFTRKSIPGIGGGDSIVAGAEKGFQLSDIDKILDFGDKFEKLFEKAAKTLIRLKREDAGTGEREPLQPGETPGPGYYSPEGQRFNVVDSSSRVVEEGEPMPAQRATGSVGATNGQITAEKIYKVALGALANLQDMDADMTVSEALVKARENKKMVIPMIEEALLGMATPEEE